jgi:hypothetical protein
MNLLKQISARLGSPGRKDRRRGGSFLQSADKGDEENSANTFGLFKPQAIKSDKSVRIKAVRHNINESNINALIAELTKTVDNPDVNIVLKLGFVLLEKLKVHNIEKSSLRAGILFIEWCRLKSVELSPTECSLLAKAHFEMWLSGGFEIDKFHLNKALELYESCLESTEVNQTSHTWIQYCQALQISGDLEKATTVILSILSSFEDDVDYPSFLFFAGGLYKAQSMHDKASNYFFEATQIGPPKFFTKLEMMCIISRNIEEAGKSTDDNSDDAYKMVNTHTHIT